jgi:hypothetical protein
MNLLICSARVFIRKWQQAGAIVFWGRTLHRSMETLVVTVLEGLGSKFESSEVVS